MPAVIHVASPSEPVRGRFAPSPTGRMHLGNARTALLGWLACRARGGAMVLRLEDLNQARGAPAVTAQLYDDLRWLGLDWDEGPDRGGPHAPYEQTARREIYDAAVARLLAGGDAFLCACSRADVARAASAPHATDEAGPRYPGTCRARDPAEIEARARAAGRAPSVRFAGGGRPAAFVDDLVGPVDPLGPAGLDDFVIRRADGVAAYQLAVVVDDAAMAITEVVRGDDLLASTPRQLAIYAALGARPPHFCHVPLVLSPAGERLAKRTRPASLGNLRTRGVPPEAVVGALAASAGLVPPGTRISARELVHGFDLSRIERAPAVLDAAALEPNAA